MCSAGCNATSPDVFAKEAIESERIGKELERLLEGKELSRNQKVGALLEKAVSDALNELRIPHDHNPFDTTYVCYQGKGPDIIIKKRDTIVECKNLSRKQVQHLTGDWLNRNVIERPDVTSYKNKIVVFSLGFFSLSVTLLLNFTKLMAKCSSSSANRSLSPLGLKTNWFSFDNAESKFRVCSLIFSFLGCEYLAGVIVTHLLTQSKSIHFRTHTSIGRQAVSFRTLRNAHLFVLALHTRASNSNSSGMKGSFSSRLMCGSFTSVSPSMLR